MKFNHHDTEYQNTEYQNTEYQNTEYQNTEYQNTECQNTEYQNTEYQKNKPVNRTFIYVMGFILFLGLTGLNIGLVASDVKLAWAMGLSGLNETVPTGTIPSTETPNGTIPTVTATVTPNGTIPTVTATVTPTSTPTSTSSPTATATATSTGSATPTPTATPTSIFTPLPTSTLAPTPTPPTDGDVIAALSGIQFLHFAPFTANPNDATVAVQFISGSSSQTINNIPYGGTNNGYTGVPAGLVNVNVIPLAPAVPDVMRALNVASLNKYTTILVGGANGWPLELMVFTDGFSVNASAVNASSVNASGIGTSQVSPDFAPNTLEGRVRVIHIAPYEDALSGSTASSIDIRTQNNDVVVANMPYRGDSGYMSFLPGNHDWVVTSSGGGTVLFDVPAFHLNDNATYILFVTGDNNAYPMNTPLMIQGFGEHVETYFLPMIYHELQ